MSKKLLVFLLLVSVAVSDPPRVFGLLGPQAQTFGWKLASALDFSRVLPHLSHFAKR